MLLSYSTVQGQFSTQGNEFWVTFGQGRNSAVLQIRIITNEATNVTFHYTEGGGSTVSITANTIYTHTLYESQQQAVTNHVAYTGAITKKSLHIQSDKNISVYAVNMDNGSTDATLVLPITCLGNSYYHLSYAGNDGYAIIATEDATDIYDDVTFLCTLNKGEVYTYSGGDMTGKHITSNKPIAYFIINGCTNIPMSVRFCDCLYEQLFPEFLWGTSFMIPVSRRGKDRIRILSSLDGTNISHIGGTVISGSLNLNAGEFVELEINISENGCYVESNNPIAITSYLMSSEYFEHSYIPGRLGQAGDPAMAWIPSTDQFVTEIFVTPFAAAGSSVLDSHSLLIVTKTEDKHLTKMSINDVDVPYLPTTWIDNFSGYSFCSINLQALYYLPTYKFENPNGILGLAYGEGEYESYYYLTSGLKDRKLDIAFYVNEIHYQKLISEEFCTNIIDIESIIKYPMSSDIGHLRWIVDNMEEYAFQDNLKWSKVFNKGRHNIDMIVKDEYGNIDTISSSFSIDFEEIDINDTTICYQQNIELQINTSHAGMMYKWYNDPSLSNLLNIGTSFTPSISFDTIFYIEALSDNGCKIIDSVQITHYSTIDLIIDNTNVCYNSNTILTISNEDITSLVWYSDVNYIDTIIKNNMFEIEKLKSDTIFYIEAVSKDNCKMRDTVHVTILSLPDLHVNDTTICYGKTASPMALSSNAISLKWHKSPDYSDLIVQSPSFTTLGLESDTVFYVEATSVDGCTLRDSSHVVVNPLPDLVVKDTAVCYDKSVTVKASANDATLTWYDDVDYLNPIVHAASFQTSNLTTDTAFFVKAESLYGCISYGTEQVEIYSLPNITVNDITSCYDSTTIVSVSKSDAVSLIWYSDTNYTDTITKDFLFKTDKLKFDTVFYIEALSVNGCSSSYNMHVTVPPLPNLHVTDTSVCYGKTASPMALSSNAISLKWYKSPDYSDLIAQSNSFMTAELESDIIFYVEAMDINGCISRDSIYITVNLLPDLVIEDTTLCAETTTTFTVSSNDASSLIWYRDAIYFDTIAKSTLYETTLTTDTIFYIEALSNKGCSTRDTMNILIIPKPMVVAMNDVYLCYGEEVTLSVLESDGTLSWDVNSTTVRPLHSQDYIVKASRQFCPDVYDTVTIKVGDSLYIYPPDLPSYRAFADYNQQINSNAQSPIYTLVGGNLPFGLSLYTSGNLSGNPYSDELTSVFTVQVEDNHKCTTTYEYSLEKEFYTPKVFTPNGDGINDIFMKGYKIVIFDRLGLEIFRGDDGWDGTYKNKPAPQDIYFYLITREIENGKTKIYTGYIGIR
jgi:gliding motility-associated-like protein